MSSVREWIAAAEVVAFGPLQLLPEQFETLQPQEFAALLRGHEVRERERRTEMAYWVACMMNTQLTKPVKTTDLLKPFDVEKTRTKTETDEEYMRRAFRLGGTG